jgi:hypothetical protein
MADGQVGQLNTAAVKKGVGADEEAVNSLDPHRRAASYIDRILKGEKPATCRCRTQPNMNWSSTSRPPRHSAVRGGGTPESAATVFRPCGRAAVLRMCVPSTGPLSFLCSLAARADDDLRRRYFAVLHRRGRPKARVALARKLLVRLYVMLRDQIDYDEFRRRGRATRPARPLASTM